VYGLERISERRYYVQNNQGVYANAYYLYDGHGSVRALTDASGTVTDTYDYDAFGNLIHSTGTTPNNYLFAGEQFDPDLNLYYNRARYLNTSTGRFWTMDTEEGDDNEPLSLHKYFYTEGDPVDGVDPTGSDDLATISAGFSVSETLDAMPQIQTTNLTGKLGIGIEPPDSPAVKKDVLNLAVDPGHVFVYLRNSSNKIISILSFGPGESVADNRDVFRKGTLPGNAHWRLYGTANTWESTITSPQLAAAQNAITDFKAHAPNYTIDVQCTTASLSIAKKAGLNLPDGVGHVIVRKWGFTPFDGDVANPYHLNKQMTALYGPPEVVSTSIFPAP
jgi:RHS repeat-associated protein